jgi:flavin-binding protein dodecin
VTRRSGTTRLARRMRAAWHGPCCRDEAAQVNSLPATSRITITEDPIMSVAKVIEISAESADSFEDAIRSGIEEASKTVRNVEGAWIKEHTVVVKDGRISGFRVDMKVTFILD